MPYTYLCSAMLAGHLLQIHLTPSLPLIVSLFIFNFYGGGIIGDRVFVCHGVCGDQTSLSLFICQGPRLYDRAMEMIPSSLLPTLNSVCLASDSLFWPPLFWFLGVGSHYGVQASLKRIHICLLLPPKANTTTPDPAGSL